MPASLAEPCVAAALAFALPLTRRMRISAELLRAIEAASWMDAEPSWWRGSYSVERMLLSCKAEQVS